MEPGQLVPFSSIDEYADDADVYNWTEGQLEAARFFHKMDWEGGLTGLLEYGGADYFPEELQEAAQEADDAINKLQTAVVLWGKERGVSY